MNTTLRTNHLIIYFDSVMEASDGNGWCVETSDSEMTVRFGTMAGALAYAKTEEKWLQSTTERPVL
jgi:hypothetical protein